MLVAARASGFQFGLKKCKFVEKSIDFCGLELSGDGRRITRARTEALLSFGAIKTKTDLRRLTGMAGQWRREVERLDILLRPLYKAANVKGGKLVVSPELEAAIEAVKAACSKSVTKRAYDPGLPSIVRVDGSRDGFGASLEQEGRVIALASRQKTKSEVNYVPFDTEWCAALFGLESFEPFTSGSTYPIELVSDCKGLEGIESRVTEDKTGRRAGWYERSRRFNYRVVWAPREEQKVVDALANSPQFRVGVKAERDELIREEAELAAREREARVSAAEVVVTEAVRRDDAWWRDKQLRDPKIRAIIDFKEDGRGSGEKSASSLKYVAALAANLDLQNGVLGKLIKPDKKKPLRSDWEWRVMVPDVDGLRKDLFDRCHTKEGGHMRFDQTYERLRTQAFWHGMWNDCLRWVGECTTCDEFATISGNWGLLQPRGSERLRGKRIVAVDIAGPFEKTPEGYTHILVAVDETDAWVEIEPLSSMEATEVIEKFLLGEVANNGVPDIVLSDRASQFVAEYAMGIYEALGLDKKTTAPRSPWGNGTAEATIKIAKSIMKKLAKEKRILWNRTIWLVKMAMRSRTPEGMRISPFEARRGRKMVLPSAFLLPVKPQMRASEKELKEAYEVILKLRDEAAEEMKKKFDERLQKKEFVKDQLVWLRNEEVTAADPVERIGPFKVKRVAGPVNVEIEEVKNGPKLGNRHAIQSIRNMIEYSGPEPGPQPEFIVSDVVDHRGYGRGRKYRVRWNDGSFTWEPRSSLVDVKTNGKQILVMPFRKYLERNQMLHGIKEFDSDDEEAERE
jgi:hypothetical protein